MLGLGYRCDLRCGQVEGRNEMEKDKKRREVWVIGCDFRDLRRMEGQLAEHLVFFSYIQACCLRSCLLVCLCTSQKWSGCKPSSRSQLGKYIADVLQKCYIYFSVVRENWPVRELARFANRTEHISLTVRCRLAVSFPLGPSE